MAKYQNIPIRTEVASVFDSYPQRIRIKLLNLRRLILETAASIESVGEIEEALKWGESSYLTSKTKSGGTIKDCMEKVPWRTIFNLFQMYSKFSSCI